MFLKFIYNLLFCLPTSKNLTFMWNFGSMLGMILVFQILTGVLLVFYYSNDSSVAFNSIQFLMYNSIVFSFIRIFHFNGVSLFFLFLFLHFFKGLFFFSYRLKYVWVSGLTIFLIIMGESFMGYAMVWAQMSYWACIVITSLIMVVPFFGNVITFWVWNSFNIWNATLKILFVFHFLLPFVLLVIVCFHLIFLHLNGSFSSLNLLSFNGKKVFFKNFWLKDSLNLFVWSLFLFFSLNFPFVLSDPEMFIDVNLNMSPAHIVPEWYFLFAYAILRAIPNKFLGVLFLLLSIVVFYFFFFINNYNSVLNVLNKYLVFMFINISYFLSWLGQCFVEYPFPFLSLVFSFLYFLLISFFFFIFYNFKKLF